MDNQKPSARAATEPIEYSANLTIRGRPRQFVVRPHQSDLNLLYITCLETEGQRVEFELIQTSTGKWQARGNNLPGWIVDGAQQIAHSLHGF